MLLQGFNSFLISHYINNLLIQIYMSYVLTPQSTRTYVHIYV